MQLSYFDGVVWGFATKAAGAPPVVFIWSSSSGLHLFAHGHAEVLIYLGDCLQETAVLGVHSSGGSLLLHYLFD